MRIAFLHPDLGIGGAERLVVDAAVALQGNGHDVTVFTARHDPLRCFKETCDGTLDVQVVNTRIPADIGGYLKAPCAILRTINAARHLLQDRRGFDLIFCDLVAHVVPFLRRRTSAKILFYCHYPDLLLTPQGRFLRRLYRLPVNFLERRGMRCADQVLVNSRFTAETVREFFPKLSTIDVLYPGVDCDLYKHCSDVLTDDDDHQRLISFLSVNRFERKKNHRLAIDAFDRLRSKTSDSVFKKTRLTLAGGYDHRITEARATLSQLRNLILQYGLQNQVTLVTNLTDRRRIQLLQASRAFLYTPDNEHFGIGPVEAMAAGRPVISVDGGGPRETVVHKTTGLLLPPNADCFAEGMQQLAESPEVAGRMGIRGREHVREHFSRELFSERLEFFVQELMNDRTRAGR